MECSEISEGTVEEQPKVRSLWGQARAERPRGTGLG